MSSKLDYYKTVRTLICQNNIGGTLAYDLLRKPFTDDNRTKIISEIQEINLRRNQGIVGESKPASKTQDAQEGSKNGDI